MDFECHFNSSLKKYLAICEWLKDGDPAINGKKWQTTIPGFENYLICRFNINSASLSDGGNYSCYCYYNGSFREQLHIPKNHEIRSQPGSALLQIKIGKIMMLLKWHIILYMCAYRESQICFCWRNYTLYSVICYSYFHDFISNMACDQVLQIR